MCNTNVYNTKVRKKEICNTNLLIEKSGTWKSYSTMGKILIFIIFTKVSNVRQNVQL